MCKMTKLEFVNKVFFQWLFIRLTRCEQNIILGATLNSCSILPDGSHGLAYKPTVVKVKRHYAIQGWIVPITGWSNNFKFVGKRWFIKVTKPKYV
jgi:hypothetical protein